MHESVMSFVGAYVAEHELAAARTLEVGSFDVNGSGRSFFVGEFVGIDHAAGPGVDEVADACALPFGDASFDVVLSTEMLEHCERPWLAVAEMGRCLAPGGHLILTCRGFNERGAFPFHNPPDNYRFSAQALAAMLLDAGFSDFEIGADPQVPGWFVTARRP